MNKLKTEAKIGIIVISTIILVIWGINFLKGKNVLKRSDVFYAVFDDIQGIGISAPVLINGFKAGMINNIEFRENSLDKIIIAFTVEHRFKIPLNSLVELYSKDFLGSKALRILPSNSGKYHNHGDTLFSSVKKDLTTSITEELVPLKSKIESAVGEIDTLIATFNEILDEGTSRNLQNSISNLNNVSQNLSHQLSPGGDLDETLKAFKVFSLTLSENRDKLTLIFQNMASLSDSIAKLNVNSLVSSLNTTFTESSLLLEKINAGEGSLGMLASSDSLYLNLNNAIQSLDILLRDLNENPRRYVHFSVFGKKE